MSQEAIHHDRALQLSDSHTSPLFLRPHNRLCDLFVGCFGVRQSYARLQTLEAEIRESS